MAVITISREMATGGRKLGRLLAKRLAYQYVDKSLFQKIAEDLNVSERTLESFEKSREYQISNIFAKAFSTSYIERIVGYDKSVVEEEKYQKSLGNLILETAREDNVVIIGRAAYFFLKDMKNCYHIRLVASTDWKEKYALENYKISPDRVHGFIEKRDKNLRWFLRSICGAGFDDSLWFHLTLNMSRTPVEKAVELIMSVANLSG
ncbi:MAG: cytidylate kinase-like family protein [Deltaproteobacteria bacterium]|nr:cytidylate kinase-like family protein [Deltaproteobacteria bacterium]